MEHLKKAVTQWELANEKYKKDTQQFSQRIGSVLRTFWALDMKKNADNIKESIALVGMSLQIPFHILNEFFRDFYSKN